VLRALFFQHLNHFPAARRAAQLRCNVTIAGTNSDLFRIFIGGCDSARWLAWAHTNGDFPQKQEKKL
jgi:hypothetical protein